MNEYVAARKFANPRTRRNKSISKSTKPKSVNYFEPFVADKRTPEQFPHFELHCNVSRHKLKSMERMYRLYLTKNCSSQSDIIRASQLILPFSIRRQPQNKSKDFFDDATMEYVRHNLFRLSSIEGVVTSGPPASITFRSIVKGKRKTETGRVNYLLSWSPHNIVPDVWVSEEDLESNAEKTIPVSRLPSAAGALRLPAMDALGLSNVQQRKRKRK